MKRLFAIVPVLIAAVLATGPATAAVRVVRGPTPIPDGGCQSPGDITVITPHLAVCFAAQTRPPWGIPPGSIIDAAPVVDGRIQPDRAGFIDFLPDSWTPWLNTRHDVTVEPGEDGLTVVVTRDFRGFEVTTTWHFYAAQPTIRAVSVLRNATAADTGRLRSGYSLCTRAGHLFPELAKGDAPAATVAGYGPEWSIGLHFPAVTEFVGGSSWRDLYHASTVAPGASRRLEAWFTFSPRGETLPIQTLAARQEREPLGIVRGRLTDRDGAPTVVLFYRDGQPRGWLSTDTGTFAAAVPPGAYELVTAAPHHASPARHPVRVAEGTAADVTLAAPLAPARVMLQVREAGSHRPIDARVELLGAPPVVRYLTRRVFYTALDTPGAARFALAPGRQQVRVQGGGLAWPARTLTLDLEPGAVVQRTAELAPLVDRRARGQQCADLHHHSDLVDGQSAPRDVVRSQLAAGLDFTFVSDHDTVGSHAEVAALSKSRGIPFIPSIEVSPPWGHFNLYPLPVGTDPALESMSVEASEIFAAARRLGVHVQVNHPYEEGANAYFHSGDRDKVPGGFQLGFSFVEINADNLYDGSDSLTVARVREMWSKGTRVYLTGGSDTHDVHTVAPDERSGRVRTCAILSQTPASSPPPGGSERQRAGGDSHPTQNYLTALTAGRSYITFGPLLFPTPAFGTTLTPDDQGSLTLTIQAVAVSGLSKAVLRADGAIVARRVFPEAPPQATMVFSLPAGRFRWLALEVYDLEGNPALANPWWGEESNE